MGHDGCVTTGIAVHGTDHAHVVELTQKLAEAGAEVRSIVATDDGIGPWLASQYPDARSTDPYGDDIDIVVCAAIPSERAQVAINAMHAGKDVVLDKPGVTTVEQLDEIRRVQAETGRRWLVVFNERLGNSAMSEAFARVQGGAIGTVVHTVGLGPHTLNLKHRPEWFFDPKRYGGILVDIGTHQVDQFLAFSGATTARVQAANVRTHRDHDGVQVLGEMMLTGDNGATGYARVDYFTPKGLGAWGDVRFTAVGTDGYLEVRQVDNHLTLVDRERRADLDCAASAVDWARAFVAGEMPIAQSHVFNVHAACIDAQNGAAVTPA
jgi:predicted dehydrogenase